MAEKTWDELSRQEKLNSIAAGFGGALEAKAAPKSYAAPACENCGHPVARPPEEMRARAEAANAKYMKDNAVDENGDPVP